MAISSERLLEEYLTANEEIVSLERQFFVKNHLTIMLEMREEMMTLLCFSRLILLLPN